MTGGLWATLVTTLGVVLAAGLTALGTVLVRRANRRLDEANARVAEAGARHSDAETASLEVKTARDVLETVKLYFSELLATQKAEYEGRLDALRARHDAEIRAVSDRLTRMEDRERQRDILSAAHRPWDAEALAKLRADDPAYPPYPPIDPT